MDAEQLFGFIHLTKEGFSHVATRLPTDANDFVWSPGALRILERILRQSAGRG